MSKRKDNETAVAPVGSPQTMWPLAAFDTEPLPDGRIALVVHVPGAVHLFPMDADYMEQLGRKMSACRLILPPQAAQPA